MTAIDHSIELNVPVSAVLVPGPELAELTGAIARTAPEPAGAMHLELAFEEREGGLVPRLSIVWGRKPDERASVTFSSCDDDAGTRVRVVLAWPDGAGDDVGVLYARSKVVEALEHYRRRLQTQEPAAVPVHGALQPVAAAAT